MISFGAKYISPVNIEKITRKNKVISHEAAFVELEPKKKLDFVTMSILLNLPYDSGEYVPRIYFDFMSAAADDEINNDVRFFAVTERKKRYGFINPLNVYGLIEVADSINEKDALFIKYMQAIPKILFKKLNHVGTGILDGIKTNFHQKDIIGNVVNEAIPFYLKNGFVVTQKFISECLTTMRYYAKK